jgi:hypothetical protein
LVSFSLTILVNFYTLRRLQGKWNSRRP